MKKKLTPKQQRFVDEYLANGFNATQAAVDAGYSKKTAQRIGSENLSKLLVKEAIEEAKLRLAERSEVKLDQVIHELARIAFADMREFAKWGPSGVSLIDSDTLDESRAACVAEVSETVTQHGGTIRFKLHDKTRALEMLGRYFGAFTDNVSVHGEIAGVVVIPAGESADDWAERAQQQQRRIQVSAGNGRGSS